VIIKILTVAFALMGLRRALLRWRKGASLPLEFLFWALLWSGIGLVVFIPHSTDRVAQWMGVSTGFNALVFITILGLLFGVYRLFSRTQTLERELTALVRSHALQNAEHITPLHRSD
jgi:hypothetical protein